MENMFLTVLNMSLTASFIIAAIILARLPLKKAPKVISYALWAVAGFRLMFPFSIDSVFSLLPIKPEPIPQNIAMQAVPRIDSGIAAIDNAISSSLPAATPYASANPLQILLFIVANMWIIGVVIMLLYSVVSIVLLKRRLNGATCIKNNIYETGDFRTPFVVGLIRPKIYIPSGLRDDERRYIVLHEQTHIRRHDHAIKMLAYLILCLHWFNPLAWAAFILMGADMEMSCDERVLKEIGGDTKKDYSLSLLSLAANHRILSGSPLAFSEGGLKQRIKNVLNFKKPSRVVIIAAVALVTVLSVGFAVNRSVTSGDPPTITIQANGHDIDWVAGKNKWGGDIYDRLDSFTQLMAHTAIDQLEYVRDGEKITIQINGSVPSSVTLTEHILNKDGTQKYNIEGMTYNVDFDITNRTTAMITLTPNYATALSSYSADYVSGNTLKGYKLICTWGENECEYAFIIRGDAAAEIRNTKEFQPIEWVNEEIPWYGEYELELPEYPETVFEWTQYEVKARYYSGNEKTLFTGMPIWNVYVMDLNGDNLPEFCATVSFGFGMIDTRVVVYDCANDKLYELSDRGYYDYALSLSDGQLIVTKTVFNGEDESFGELAIINGELTFA